MGDIIGPVNMGYNKDILIISLLEIINKQQTTTNDSFLNSITSYLNIDKDIMSNENFNKIKDSYTTIINNFINNNKNNFGNMSIYYDRYKNDFCEIDKISTGGFGSVYKTLHKLDGCSYAIKKIPIKHISINDKVLNEAKILANLNHNTVIRYYSTWLELNYDVPDNEFSDNNSESCNNIVTYESEMESGEDLFSSESNGKEIVLRNNLCTGFMYIQMELCQMTLKQYISKCLNTNSFTIIKSILSGINYIHSKNIIHCDLSLNNILVDYDQNIKLCDFGLAEHLGDNDHIIKEKVYGQILYCAPESINNNKYSYKSDIYSLGIIIYELLNKFSTEMERITMIKKFKNKMINSKYKTILYKMISDDEKDRPYIDDIIKLLNFV